MKRRKRNGRSRRVTLASAVRSGVSAMRGVTDSGGAVDMSELMRSRSEHTKLDTARKGGPSTPREAARSSRPGSLTKVSVAKLPRQLDAQPLQFVWGDLWGTSGGFAGFWRTQPDTTRRPSRLQRVKPDSAAQAGKAGGPFADLCLTTWLRCRGC